VVSWSLLTVHLTPPIELKLMRGLYNGQQRPLTSKKDTKISFRRCPDFKIQNALTIWFQNFCRACEKAAGWKK